MAPITGTKRPNSSTDDHHNLVISNVEFAMMNFYKMQWEGQQQVNEKLHAANVAQDRKIKRMKVEAQHQEGVIRTLQREVDDVRFDLDTATAQVNGLTQANQDLAHRLDNSEREINRVDIHCLRLLGIFQDMFEGNSELKRVYNARIVQELHRFQESREELRLMTGESLDDSASEADSEATEPEMWIEDNTVTFVHENTQIFDMGHV